MLSGSAGLWIEGEGAPKILRTRDYIEISPHVGCRVEWTNTHQPTAWLAVHSGGSAIEEPQTRLMTTLTISEVAIGK